MRCVVIAITHISQTQALKRLYGRIGTKSLKCRPRRLLCVNVVAKRPEARHTAIGAQRETINDHT